MSSNKYWTSTSTPLEKAIWVKCQSACSTNIGKRIDSSSPHFFTWMWGLHISLICKDSKQKWTRNVLQTYSTPNHELPCNSNSSQIFSKSWWLSGKSKGSRGFGFTSWPGATMSRSLRPPLNHSRKLTLPLSVAPIFPCDGAWKHSFWFIYDIVHKKTWSYKIWLTVKIRVITSSCLGLVRQVRQLGMSDIAESWSEPCWGWIGISAC